MFKLATLAITAMIATPAAAQNHDWRVGNDQVHIIYSGIDTGTAAGRAMLLSRVERSAGKLCQKLIASDRRDCIADTLHQTARTARSQALALALVERDGTALATR